MLSKAKVKFIKSLQIKKYRKQEQCFIVQGAKSVQELLASSFDVMMVLGTDDFLGQTRIPATIETISVTEKELVDLGEYQSNDAALAVARMQPNKPPVLHAGDFALVLDDLRDPGNVGTILRTADWYGIRQVIASPETADFYNAKVISATMGSFVRVQVYYTELVPFLSQATLPVYGAFLDGHDVHQTSFAGGGLIVMGNESRGISDEVARTVTQRITIPRYGQAESLNAAIATAVICDNIRRR